LARNPLPRLSSLPQRPPPPRATAPMSILTHPQIETPPLHERRSPTACRPLGPTPSTPTSRPSSEARHCAAAGTSVPAPRLTLFPVIRRPIGTPLVTVASL
jgi:hypothetical protein